MKENYQIILNKTIDEIQKTISFRHFFCTAVVRLVQAMYLNICRNILI